MILGLHGATVSSGRKCPSALLVHEGTTDVNDNFRYATAHILAVRRENVEVSRLLLNAFCWAGAVALNTVLP